MQVDQTKQIKRIKTLTWKIIFHKIRSIFLDALNFNINNSKMLQTFKEAFIKIVDDQN